MKQLKYAIVLTFFLFTELSLCDDLQVESLQVTSIEKTIISNSSITLTNGRTYSLQESPLDLATQNLFDQLSKFEKNKFFEFRNKIISTIISRVDSNKRNRFIGRSIILKDKLVNFVLRNKKDINDDNNAVDPVEKIDYEDIDKINLGQAQLQKFVSKIDTLLWQNCLTLGKKTSTGFSVALHGNLGLGALKKGALLNLSLGIGYQINIETGKQYLEFFFMREKFNRAYTYAAPVFLGVRVNWLNIRNDNFTNPNNTKSGVGHIFPLWLPKIYFSNDEFQLVNKFGVDFLDLALFGQTAAQFYETGWDKYFFRVNLFKSRKSTLSTMCMKHYSSL